MALTHEDTYAGRGKEKLEYWSLARVMEEYRNFGKSVVDYATLPSMQAGQRPTGWNAWDHPWALLDIAEKDLPVDRGI